MATEYAFVDPPSGERPEPATARPDVSQQQERARILQQFYRDFRLAKAHWEEWRQEARDLYDLIAGRQWPPEDEARMREQMRPMVTFNVAGKYLDSVVGLQINNRQDIRYFPREVGDAQVNELLTGAVAWGRDLSNMVDDETDAFFDCILTGLGWMEGYLDRDLDPGGVPAGSRVDPLEMFPDPRARKRNLEDARFVIRIRWVDQEEYQDIVGEEDAGNEPPELGALEAEDDNPLEFVEEPRDYDQPGTHTAIHRSRRPVADYQYWRRERAFFVRAQGYGERVFSAKQWAALEPLLKRAKRQYQATPLKRRVYYRAIIAGSRVVQYGLSPYQHGFTFHAITGKRDRNKGTWYGIGRAILDPQRWVNVFFSTILYTVMTNAKGGLLAENDAFENPRKAEAEWANPAAITWLQPGAISKGKIQLKEPARYPEGLDRLLQFSMAVLPQTSGLNLELLGLADRVQAGVVEAQRKQSAMAIIAWAFDAMRRYYRSMGRQLAAYVRDYVPENTLILVNGESGRQYVPLVKQHLPHTFDIIVDEAPTSTNMKERVWLVLEQLIPQLLQAGMTIPPEVLDYSPLPADLAEKWKQALQPDPQKRQIDEQMVANTLRKLVSEALRNETQAQLNQAKALKEAAEAGAAQADTGNIGGHNGP